MGKASRILSSSQIIFLGFALVILLGSLALTLPVCSDSGEHTPFLDALFTATSAVCVTGLVVRDTALYWSPIGQAVILALIQIGGMGVVTVAVAFFTASGRRISLKQRSTMQEAISAHQMGGIVRLTGFIIRMTLVFELIGALCLFPAMAGKFGPVHGMLAALFTSVSAFCNAGFDLMGSFAPYSSLTHFVDDPSVNLTVCALIAIGGIGFMTWDDVRAHGLRIRRYRMQSKVILLTTALLIIIPAAYFFFFEFAGLPAKTRVLASLFQSVTPRTAGFNTVDLTAMSDTGQMVIIALMLIGGSPGSTAGGMKTTTFAVMLCTAFSVFGRREHSQFFGRRVAHETVRSACAILMLYLTLFLAGGMLISRAENLPLLTCLFESASAVGTVGLTLGITPQLGSLSRIVLIALMFIGRVGGLTLIFAATKQKPARSALLPLEKLTVG